MSKDNNLILGVGVIAVAGLGAYAYSKKDEIKKFISDSANKDLSGGNAVSGGGITDQYGGGEPIAGAPESIYKNNSSIVNTPSGNQSSVSAIKNQVSNSSSNFSYSPDPIYDSGNKGLAGAYYDKSGKISAVADPITKQSRAPTPVEKLFNNPVFGSPTSSSTKQSTSNKVANVVKTIVTAPTKLSSAYTKIISSGIKKIFRRK